MSANDTPSTPLQFDVAVHQRVTPGGSTGTVTCASCKRTISDQYFDVGGQTVCESCSQQFAQHAQVPTGLGPLLRAGLFGLGAAIAGAVLYYAVIAITDFEIGIVAIAIGYMVGYAVHAGTRRRGGRRFQVLAVLLTYWAVGLAYTPFAVQGVVEDDNSSHTSAAAVTDPDTVTTVAAGEPTERGGQADGAQVQNADAADAGSLTFSGAIALLLGISFALPILAIVGSLPGGLISAAIIGFGMMQAWQMTSVTQVEVTGPYRLNAEPPALA